MTTAAEQTAAEVYRLFAADPEGCRSSYLYDHYKRGLSGIMKPTGQPALSAWKAGREAAMKASKK